jgi:hypothetical protein
VDGSRRLPPFGVAFHGLADFLRTVILLSGPPRESVGGGGLGSESNCGVCMPVGLRASRTVRQVGVRGHEDDPLYRIRAVLRPGVEHLNYRIRFLLTASGPGPTPTPEACVDPRSHLGV